MIEIPAGCFERGSIIQALAFRVSGPMAGDITPSFSTVREVVLFVADHRNDAGDWRVRYGIVHRYSAGVGKFLQLGKENEEG